MIIYNPGKAPFHFNMETTVPPEGYLVVDTDLAAKLRQANPDLVHESDENFPSPWLRYNA